MLVRGSLLSVIRRTFMYLLIRIFEVLRMVGFGPAAYRTTPQQSAEESLNEVLAI